MNCIPKRAVKEKKRVAGQILHGCRVAEEGIDDRTIG